MLHPNPSPSGQISRLLTQIDEIMTRNAMDEATQHMLRSFKSDLSLLLSSRNDKSPTEHVMENSLSFASMRPSAATNHNGGQEDLEASRWLAKTFASIRFSSSPQYAPKQVGLGFQSDGMPALELSLQDMKVNFSRPHRRLEPALVATGIDTFEQISECMFQSMEYLPSVGTDSFNVLDIFEEMQRDSRRLFTSVAASIFSQYTFFHSLSIPPSKFGSFITTVFEAYNETNPFHNSVRAADVLQMTHSFFKQAHISSNFSDVEIVATLVAAMCLDIGHLGVSNDFLSRIGHTLVSIYGDHSPQESASLALAMSFITRDELNIFGGCDEWLENPKLSLEFRRIITEIILGSSTRSHEALASRIAAVIQSTTVNDDDVPFILAGVVHAADFGFAMKPKGSHIEWVTMLLTEYTRQGLEEERRRIPVSPLCNTDAGEHTAAALHALIRFVLYPFFELMMPFLPSWWSSLLAKNLLMHEISSATSGKEDDDHATSPPILFEARDVDHWTDSSHPVLSVVRKAVGGSQAHSLLDRKASQHAILHATPQRQLSVNSLGDSFSAPNRTEHYFSFLRLFESCDREKKSFSEFGGNLVFLALQLDAQYLGEYAAASSHPNTEECASIADTIVSTEQAPSTAEMIASPTKRNKHTTDAFVLQLLHMYRNRVTMEERASLNDSVSQQQSRRRIVCDNPIYSHPSQPKSFTKSRIEN